LVSANLLQLLAQLSGREREMVSLARDIFLALAAQDVAQEFTDLRIGLRGIPGERVGREIDVGAAGKRIGAARDILAGERDERAARRLRERERLHLRRAIRIAGVRN